MRLSLTHLLLTRSCAHPRRAESPATHQARTGITRRRSIAGNGTKIVQGTANRYVIFPFIGVHTYAITRPTIINCTLHKILVADSLARPPPLPPCYLSFFSPSILPRFPTSPRPILPQPHLCVSAIVKIDLRDRILNQSPDAPVETRDATEAVDFVEQSLFEVFPLLLAVFADGEGPGMGVVAVQVFTQKSPPNRARWKHARVTRQTAPFCEMVS